MQLECKGCRRTLNLPDARLPLGRPFYFTCPYCQMKNTALVPGPGGPEPAAAPARPAEEAPPAPKPAPEPLRAAADQEPPAKAPAADLQSALSEAVDDRPRAMVVFDAPETQELLVRKLEDGGYKASAALNLRDAAKQLKFANFTLLILQENYCGVSLHGNLLLRSLQTIDISSRRGMLVILVSPHMTSLDDLTAFGLSIDGIINLADLESLDRLLVSITARARKFYAIYQEVLAEYGV